MEGRVGPRSARQYITTVSRYHEDAGHVSPTKTRLVASLLKAYEKKVDRTAGVGETRTGLEASVMRRVIGLGLQTERLTVLAACAMVLFGFMFQARSVTVDHVAPEDVEFAEDHGLSVRLVYRKAKPTARPLLLRFPYNPAWEVGSGPNDVLSRWDALRPGGRGFFNLRSQDELGAASLGSSLKVVLSELDIAAPSGYYYASHSARIGAFNELAGLGFSKVWLLHRMDWTSEAMFKVYFDSRIERTLDSEWFFAHLPGA